MTDRVAYVAAALGLAFCVGLQAGRAEPAPNPDPIEVCGPYTEAVAYHDDGAVTCIPG